MLLAVVDFLHYLFMIPLALLSVFLVLVILVQRGRGGGLTGALGGMGGQSAFGTKAGDLFTRITIVVAAIWVVLSMASLKVLNQRSATANLNASERGQRTTAPVNPGAPNATTPSSPATGDAPAEKAPDDAAPAKTEGKADGAAAPAAVTTPATPASEPAATPAPSDAGTKSADAKSADEAKP